ncbi:hypothetical protein [Phenylobacterium sp.]|uniref:hypothetical protein n=1 Tax=Phenylobacterium sp. TaxID=1871053 RepID=UPI002737B5FD|nr:hypothetical protein [Phenylobacterium sp.]MDP3869467.1 hypothetical protein [Phenylobacterium sp.]
MGETPTETRPTVAQAIVILMSGVTRGLGRICFTSRWRIVIFWNFVMLLVFCALPRDWKLPGATAAGFLLVVHLGIFSSKG